MKKPLKIEDIKCCDMPRQAIHLDWYDVGNYVSELLTKLLKRKVIVEAERSEFYYWDLVIQNNKPISEKEMNSIYELIEADDLDKESNEYEDEPIMGLCQSVSRKLMSILLPFKAVYDHADDDGIWFFGETRQIQALIYPVFPDKMPVGDELYDAIYDGVAFEYKAYEDDLCRKGVHLLLENIYELNTAKEVAYLIADEMENCFELEDDLPILKTIYQLTKKGLFLQAFVLWASCKDSVDVSNIEHTEQAIRDFCKDQFDLINEESGDTNGSKV